MEERALFVPDGEAFVGTILCQGGWGPDAANGGAVLSLLGHCLEDVPSLVPMTVSRFTADLHRPVPIGRRLRVVPTVVRDGRKIQVVELRVLVDDVEHARATVLRLRDAEVDGGLVPASTTGERPTDALVRPAEATSVRSPAPTMPGFLRAVDMRWAARLDGAPGQGCWIRLEVPVVVGEPVRPTARLAFGFDYANLIGVDVAAARSAVTMINPDVTAHVLRVPTGDWIGIAGDTRFHPGLGRGVTSATLSDDGGVFAVVSLSQLVQPVDQPVDQPGGSRQLG